MRVHVVPPHERYLSQSAETRFIFASPEAGLRLIVVIPCHNEPDLLGTLQHLAKCNPPLGQAEVIVVINSSAIHSEADHEQNLASRGQVTEWLEKRELHKKLLMVNIQIGIMLLHLPVIFLPKIQVL